jgi:hypothetical protein
VLIGIGAVEYEMAVQRNHALLDIVIFCQHRSFCPIWDYKQMPVKSQSAGTK